MKFFLSAILCLLLFSCKKNDIDNNNNLPAEGISIPSLTPVTGSVAGKLIDENNNPVANAQVHVGVNIVTTDNAGFFNSGNITLDKYITSVNVNIPGYYPAYRTFSANPTKNYLFIKLIRKQVAGSFNTSAGGQVNLSNGTTILFPVNCCINEQTGSPYVGAVTVYASYIDPTSPDIASVIPGGLLGTTDSKLFVLRSTGMLAMELQSDAGAPLQLAINKTVSVKLPIPASLTAEASSTINTWSLTEKGVWKKEGTANRNGNFYEFEATHFSFWNCDVPLNPVYLNLHIQTSTSLPLVNTAVSITSATRSNTGYGITDSMGNVSGFVPENEILNLNLSALTCLNVPFYTQQIGPYSINSAQTITTSIPATQLYTLSGHVTNCAGNNLIDGTALINYNNYSTAYVNIIGGVYTYTFVSCNPIGQVKIMVADYLSNQQSFQTTIPVTGNAIDAGIISACGNTIDEYINYTIGNANYTITSNSVTAVFNAYEYAGHTFISGNDVNIVRSLSFITQGNVPGSFAIRTDSLEVNYAQVIPGSNSLATFSSYGQVGEFITGSINTWFSNDGGISFNNLTGTFRVKRR